MATVNLLSGITVAERDRQEREEGDNPRATRYLVVTGTDNGGDAYAAVVTYLANYFDDGSGGIATYDIPLKSIKLSKLEGADAFDVECLFEFPANAEAGNDVNEQGYEQPDVQEADYQFTATGATSHITHSAATLYAVPAVGEQVRNFGGGIGLNSEGTYDGVDVLTPRCNFTISQSFPKAWFNSNYRKVVAACVGCINKYAFDGFPAGCVQLKSVDAKPVWFSYTDPATGNQIKDWYWRASYRFDVAPRATLTFGGQTIYKRGFDYLWKLTEKTEDANGNAVSRVVQVNVEQVYSEYDFNELELPIPS
ncbi:MAG: hypothetical protein II622_06880 [Thermoguttaceae bacterium]|nr:hypothetical protein [Thermoguttaceae bacterium]